MALRNHSLDDKITAAALEEFLEKGYTGASLRKIAEKAGVTVGAIQTRYKSKNELFLCLLTPFLNEIEATFRQVKADYYSGRGEELLTRLKASMQHESQAILSLIFARYQEAVLLFCRSAGSSLEHYFDMVVQSKLGESIVFFRSAGYTGVGEKLLGLLISMQFDSYRRIVRDCPDRREAEAYMNSLITYHYGGWVALFDSVEKDEKVKEDKRDEI